MIAETKTSLARVCAAMVPEEANNIRISLHGRPFLGYGGTEVKFHTEWLPLPEGDWQILGELGHITEEQAALVMPPIDDSSLAMGYENYMGEGEFAVSDRVEALPTALLALRTLTDSMEVYAVNPYGEEPDPADYFDTKTPIDQFTEKDKQGLTEYGSKDMDWEYAQSRTGRWMLIYEPIK